MLLSLRSAAATPLLLVFLMLLQPMASISGTSIIPPSSDDYFISAREEGSNNSSEIFATLDVLATHQNAANGHTYHLLEPGNRSLSAEVAQSLGGELVSVDDSSENQWIVSTFTSWNGTPRNLWIGLSDSMKEGFWQWDATQPSWYRNWARSEPTMNNGEDFVYISSQPISNEVEIGQWMDSVEEPEGLVIHGLVEVGGGLDHAVYFPQPMEEEPEGEPEAYGMISQVEGLSVGDSLTMEVRVMPENLEGTRFIMMKGDYGWGMQLTDGVLQYANDYAIRNHPAAEGVVLFENEWAHLAITVVEDVGGAFYIDGQWVANISAEDAVIPSGDFGSNSCYQSGADCDEFYVARQGAGCDCNHYSGALDDIKVWNRSLSAQEVSDSYNGAIDPASANGTLFLELAFNEGTGNSSFDEAQNLKIELFNTVWVDLDGNELNNPKQLFNDDEMWDLSGKEGSQQIFWIEIPERVQFLNVQFWGWDGQALMYVRRGAIPTESSNDYASSQNSRGDDIDFGWGNGYFAWPEAGVYWIVVEGQSQFDHYSLSVWWNQLPPPPPLEQMTQLHDGIPVPDQDIGSNQVSYYYVDVTEPIDVIEISTYGGNGDADLYVAYDTDPTEWSGNGNWWGEDGIAIGGRQGQPGGGGNQGSGDTSSTQGEEKYASSAGPSNDEKVTLYGPAEGIWCIAVEAFEKVSDLTIVARFTYPPANADPINSIELEPGVTYSPVDGNAESDRHFHINVTNSVERLEVQLQGGEGDADLYVSFDEIPSREEHHLHSATFGNSEFTSVDMPISGTYHILVTGWGQFNDATITASFKEASDYVPEILPIRLFNEEPVHNLRAMEGDELSFYIELDDGIDSLSVMLSSGNGNPNLFVENADDDWQSTRQGVWETVWIETPDQGRYDISVVAARDFEGTSITASWYDWNEPDIPDIPTDIMVDCKETADFMMELIDLNSDGVLDMDELWSMDSNQNPDWGDGWEDDWDIVWEDDWEDGDGDSDSSTSGRQRGQDEPQVDDDDIFSQIDSDGDGEVTYNELLIFSCSCSTELELAEDLYGEMDKEDFNDFNWKNDFSFDSLDIDGDGMVDWGEFSRAQDSCETTWDPFDLNGGDEKPEPSPEDDTSKDGILGTEYLADVDDEVLYSMVAGVGIVLLLLVIMAFAQVKKSDELETWGEMEGDIISRRTEAMLNKAEVSPDSLIATSSEQSSPDSITIIEPESIASPAVEVGTPAIDMGDMLSDLGLDDNPIISESSTTPPDHIMGSLQADGSESLEWPSGSGNHFSRTSFDAPWSRK